MSFSDESFGDALVRARASNQDVFVLSTCLRVEIVWVGYPEAAPGVLTSLYGETSMLSHGAMRTDREAFLHLCRIAAGLDSPLVGEVEVLTQFRQAVRRLGESATSESELAKVLQAAIGVGRFARRSLSSTPHGSLASEAARTVASSGRVAILGGGAMARVAAQQLDGVEVSVFTRRPGTVAGKQSRPWENVSEALTNYPAVISTVPGGVPPFTDSAVLRSLDRRAEPLLFVDLGMPPAFTRLPRTDSFHYVGVDDVASSVEVSPTTEAEEAAAGEARAVWRRLTVPERVGSIITAMLDHAELAVEDEVRRFANRLAEAPDPETVLRQMAHTVARRILHPPISYVGSTPLGPAELDVVAEAFGLQDE